jgi:hypothetical protein
MGISISSRKQTTKFATETAEIPFFDIKGNVHFALFHKAKESTKFIVWKYWSNYVKLRKKA